MFSCTLSRTIILKLFMDFYFAFSLYVFLPLNLFPWIFVIITLHVSCFVSRFPRVHIALCFLNSLSVLVLICFVNTILFCFALVVSSFFNLINNPPQNHDTKAMLTLQ